MSLEQRIRELEEELSTDEDLPLAERLAGAIEAARQRQLLGLPRPSPQWENDDSPLGERLRQGWERAEGLRRQLRS